MKHKFFKAFDKLPQLDLLKKAGNLRARGCFLEVLRNLP